MRAILADGLDAYGDARAIYQDARRSKLFPNRGNGGLAVAGRGEELLGAHARALDDDVGLRAGPLERLLDLGAGGVRQLGRLVAGLLEETVAARLGVMELGAGIPVRLRQDLARLGLRAMFAGTLANFMTATIAGFLL